MTDTNLEQKTEKSWKDIGKECGWLLADSLLAAGGMTAISYSCNVPPERALAYGYFTGFGVLLRYMATTYRSKLKKPHNPEPVQKYTEKNEISSQEPPYVTT